MGTDITSYAEVCTGGTWNMVTGLHPDAEVRYARERDEVFLVRDYALFGFLAGVRNYAFSPVISVPRGLPADVSPQVRERWRDESITSWLGLAELLAYDYDQVFWNRRITRQIGPNLWTGAGLAVEGEGTYPVLRDFLGEGFFATLELLKGLGDPEDVRVVFWFDT